MRKKFKKIATLLLAVSMCVCGSLSAFAADSTDKDAVTIINVFDPSDPHLEAIVDPFNQAVTRTTSRPTSHYNLDDAQYTYSAYSNNNVMWSKYIFDTLDGQGKFRVYGQTISASKNYRVVFHNCDNGKDYYYSPTDSSGFDCYDFTISSTFRPSSFYFGIDTTVSKSAVSVNGFVDTY
ncbi:MAG: hypothetical protein Q4F29_08755 [Lachnospiraceae bacterium]|nr:hypothetical protein [Lachnospiraceae bacterium]